MNTKDHLSLIGSTAAGIVPFGLRQDDRRHHLYVIGKTGSGKTTANTEAFFRLP